MAMGLRIDDWEQNPSARLAAVLPLAALVTLFLFSLMRAMIAMHFGYADLAALPADLAINRTIPERPVHKPRVLPKPVKDVTPPPPPRLVRQRALPPSEALASAPLALPKPAVNTLAHGKALVFAHRDVQPLVHTAPLYPARAAEQGLEGTCTGLFDVSAKGIPYNIKVTCSSPVFIKAAERAIENWRYRPGVEEGVAVPRRGIRVPFQFRLSRD